MGWSGLYISIAEFKLGLQINMDIDVDLIIQEKY